MYKTASISTRKTLSKTPYWGFANAWGLRLPSVVSSNNLKQVLTIILNQCFAYYRLLV